MSQASPSTSKLSVEETPSHKRPYIVVDSWFIPSLANSTQLSNAEGTCIVEVPDEETRMDSSSDSSDSSVGKGKGKHAISDATKDMVPLSKRFAVASPARQTYDRLHSHARYSQETLKQKSAAWRAERVHLKNQIAALQAIFEQSHKQTQQTTAQNFAALKADYEAKIAENNASESGLVDHVYQLDQQNKDLASERRLLIQRIAEQDTAITSIREEVTTIRTQCQRQERELSDRERELLSMRQQAQVTSPASAAQRRTPRSRPTPVLRNPPVTLGTVPLVLPNQNHSSSPRLEEPLAPNPTIPNDLNTLNTIPTDIFKSIVQETLRQIGVEQVDVSRPPRRISRRSASSKAVKEQQQKMNANNDSENVRIFWRSIYELPTAADFISYVPAAPELVAACNAGAPVPPDLLQLDFEKGFERSRWNSTVLKRLYQKIVDLRAEEGGWDVPDVSEGYLLGLLHGHLKRSRDAWAKPQRRFSSQLGRVETEAEAATRASNYNDARLATVTSRSRRKAKFERRKRVVRQVIALKAETAAPDFEAWEYFVKMLDLLGVDGMSSEEEDVRDFQGQTITVFVVKLCFWRADEITQYIKFIDKEAANIQGPQNRQTQRLGSEILSTTLAKGLPRKMYHPQWLAGMEARNTDYAEQELCVSKEVFDLLVLATHST